MDANKVLSDYITFSNNHHTGTINEYNFSSNGILEFFGKTFRGSKIIHQQLR